MEPGSLRETAEKFAAKSPRARAETAKAMPVSEIEPVFLSEYGEKCQSEKLQPGFLNALSRILTGADFSPAESPVMLANRIDSLAQSQNAKISCRLVGQRLYFSFQYGEPEIGFYYLSYEAVGRLRQRALGRQTKKSQKKAML